MQTFLPYADFAESARVLDNKRLGKQRVEANQILNTLDGLSSGWANHPAVKMWRCYEPALELYRDTIIAEWISRGFKNTLPFTPISEWGFKPVLPWWVGMERFHASHRSNLLRKYPSWYKKFNWHEPHDLPYIWPESVL